MIKYLRHPVTHPDGHTTYAYQKGHLMTSEKRIPQEVMAKFEFTNTVEYDDEPSRRRCIFCDAPQKRQKYLNGVLHDLCEWHWQHVRLGQIAAQVKENAKAAAVQQAKLDAKEQARKELWHKQHPNAGKKKRKRTKLSEIIS